MIRLILGMSTDKRKVEDKLFNSAEQLTLHLVKIIQSIR